MAISDYERLFFEHRERLRRESFGQRLSRLHEFKTEQGETKARFQIGIDPDGEPVLSPWIYMTDMRGSGREHHSYKVGQSGFLHVPHGDFRQATFRPGPESTENPLPDHAEKEGVTGHTYQMRSSPDAQSSVRTTQQDQFTEHWLVTEEPTQQGEQGSDGQQQPRPGKGTNTDPEKADVLVRMGERGGAKNAKPTANYLIRAKSKITFQVGGSTIVITPSAITLNLGGQTIKMESGLTTYTGTGAFKKG